MQSLQGRRAVAIEVKAAIDRAGKTVREVADEAEISLSTLYRKLSGDTSFSVDELFSLAKVLDLSVRHFVPDAETVAQVRVPKAVA